MASIAIRPLAGPDAASISITMSPRLPPVAEALVADVVRDVAARQRHLLDHVERALLELAALAGAALALGGELGLRLAGVVQPLHLALQLAELFNQLVVRLGAASTSRTTAALKSASGLWPSSAENWRTSSCRDSTSAFVSSSLSWCCTAVLRSAPKLLATSSDKLLRVRVKRFRHRAALLAEEVLELLLEAVRDLRCSLREGLLDLGRHPLELVLDEVHLGGRRLAIEHSGADLHRLDHGVLRRDVAFEPPRGKLGKRAILNQQAVDEDAVIAQFHAALVQLQCLGSFHLNKSLEGQSRNTYRTSDSRRNGKRPGTKQERNKNEARTNQGRGFKRRLPG